MYSIMMKDGKIINVNATGTGLWEEAMTLTLYNGVATVGVFNMDSIIGWIDSDYMAESDDALNKIKAEIEAMSGDIETIADVLAIIDKYKIKSED